MPQGSCVLAVCSLRRERRNLPGGSTIPINEIRPYTGSYQRVTGLGALYARIPCRGDPSGLVVVSISIKRHEIRNFIEECIAPRFPQEWFVFGKESLARRSEYLLQGFSLYRLSHSKTFRLQHYLQVLAIPAEHVHLMLGGSIPRQRSKALLSRIRGVSSDPWFRWEVRFEAVDEIVELVHSHMQPSVDEPLTLTSVAPIVAGRAQASTHSTVLWSDAVVKALVGDLGAARKEMVAVRHQLLDEQKRDENARLEIRNCLLQRQRDIEIAIEALANRDNFDRYCKQTSRTTASALGLPG